MIVKVNILELASELANIKLREEWDYRDGQMLVGDDHGGLIYSDKAQDIFNGHYDFYYSTIEDLKE